jgi:TMEM175 potassium channel family protein
VSQPSHSDVVRLEAFSDGVFAIAITLLVLEIRVPDEAAVARAGSLFAALRALWPSYAGYAISFLVIGIMWANHHAMFRYIRRCDRNLLLINVLFLMCVSFLPFPTAVMADYLRHPGEQQPAMAFYSATLFVIALAFNAVWRYGTAGRRLLDPAADEEAVATISRRYLVGPLAYAATVALAFVDAAVCLAAHFLLAAFWAIPERRQR